MLNFFKKIRRKLIDEGNLKRYLIYACGEVLLVMVGILLALQVNNWSERIKNKEVKIKGLAVIQSNLQEERKRLNTVIGYKEADILKMQQILNGNFDTDEELDIHVLNGFHKHLPCNAGYKTMIQNNSINLIESKALINELINFYEIFYSFLTDAGTYDADLTQNEIMPYLIQYFPSEKSEVAIRPILKKELKKTHFRNLILEKIKLFEWYIDVMKNRAFTHMDKLEHLIEEELSGT